MTGVFNHCTIILQWALGKFTPINHVPAKQIDHIGYRHKEKYFFSKLQEYIYISGLYSFIMKCIFIGWNSPLGLYNIPST